MMTYMFVKKSTQMSFFKYSNACFKKADRIIIIYRVRLFMISESGMKNIAMSEVNWHREISAWLSIEPETPRLQN